MVVNGEVAMAIEPYKHDCKECKWVGWFTPYADKVPMNVYICQHGNETTVIIRFSDEGSDYWSATAGELIKGSMGFLSQAQEDKCVDLIEQRKEMFK